MSAIRVWRTHATCVRGFGIRTISVRAYGKGFSREEQPRGETKAETGRNVGTALEQDVGDATQATPNAVDASKSKSSPILPTREQVLAACLSTSTILSVVGVAVYLAAPYTTSAKGTELFDTLHTSSLVGHVDIRSTVATLATVAGVTGARALLLSVWDDFRAATDASNCQVLVPLEGNPVDVLVVGSVPAFAEEFLFRFALLPAISPDWRGAIISGLVFGALHVNGGRNAAFAAWASGVGAVYGALYLYTGSFLSSAVAHALANVLSACLWWATNSSSAERCD